MKIEELEKTLSKKERDLFDILMEALDWVKKHTSWEPIFMSRTVEELLFGYEDPLLALIHKYKPDYVSNPIFGFSVSIICMYIFLLLASHPVLKIMGKASVQVHYVVEFSLNVSLHY